MSKNEEFCLFCGSVIESGSQFCQNCGAALSDVEKTLPAQSMPISPSASTGYYQQPAVQQGPYYQQTTTVYVPQKKEDTMGILAVIMGILGWIGVLPIIGHILAIVFGHIARNRTKSIPGLVGLILGYSFFVIVGIILMAVFISISV